VTIPEEYRYSKIVAKACGWDKETTRDLGLMLWCLFRYYAQRAAAEPNWRNR
jgi:hypothetical protein